MTRDIHPGGFGSLYHIEEVVRSILGASQRQVRVPPLVLMDTVSHLAQDRLDGLLNLIYRAQEGREPVVSRTLSDASGYMVPRLVEWLVPFLSACRLTGTLGRLSRERQLVALGIS